MPLQREASDSISWQKQVLQVFKSNGLEQTGRRIEKILDCLHCAIYNEDPGQVGRFEAPGVEEGCFEDPGDEEGCLENPGNREDCLDDPPDQESCFEDLPHQNSPVPELIYIDEFKRRIRCLIC